MPEYRDLPPINKHYLQRYFIFDNFEKIYKNLLLKIIYAICVTIFNIEAIGKILVLKSQYFKDDD